MATILLDLQVATADSTNLPGVDLFQHWVNTALMYCKRDETIELTIRIVDEEESRYLNHTYRHNDNATNVLSFPFESPIETDITLLGDLVICKQFVEKEAVLQNKLPESHWAHMVVHGCLHLLGYDHIQDDDADIMESLETDFMKKLGYSDPYQSEK